MAATKMDLDAATVMRPKLIRIGDSCYRRLDVEPDGIIDDYTPKLGNRTGQSQAAHMAPKNNSQSTKKYNIDELEASDFVANSSAVDGINLEEELILGEGEEFKNDNRGWLLKIHVCSTVYPFIIGKRGQTKMNIERDTQTRLTIPRQNESRNGESNFIVISGADKGAVLSAKQRIDSLVESFRGKQVLTHFVAIPLGTNLKVRQRFETFKIEVLADVKCSVAKGIDESVFQFGPRLHLTLRALYLGDSYERKQATNLLTSFKADFLDAYMKDKPKIKLRVKGLDYMNDDPTEVNVLYAKVEETGDSGHFKEIVNRVFDCFTPISKGDFGFEQHSEWKVKIHATLLNSRFRDKQQPEQTDEPTGGNGNTANNKNRKFKRSTMDVSNIMNKFGQFDFGLVTFEQLHICTVNAHDPDNDDYYVTLAKIDL